MSRCMPDRFEDDFSNIRAVVAQFRALGYGDTYILETVMNSVDIRNGRDFLAEQVKFASGVSGEPCASGARTGTDHQEKISGVQMSDI